MPHVGWLFLLLVGLLEFFSRAVKNDVGGGQTVKNVFMRSLQSENDMTEIVHSIRTQ